MLCRRKPSSEEAPETPDLQGAYPRLSDAQIAALDAQGQRRPTRPGDVLFAEGDRECDFFIVLAGRMASVEGKGIPEERVIAVHGRGRFLGELSLLTGEGAWYSAVALDAGEVLAVPVGRLRELVARDPVLGDLVLRAYLLRRSILIGLGAGLRIVGSKYSPDTRRVRDFAVGDVRPATRRPPSVRARWRSGSPSNEQVPPRRSTMMKICGPTPRSTQPEEARRCP